MFIINYPEFFFRGWVVPLPVMQFHFWARMLIIAGLIASLSGAYIASVWHEPLFHAHKQLCDHPNDHDHDNEQSGHDHEGEEHCLLCDFFFCYDMPIEGLRKIDAPASPSTHHAFSSVDVPSSTLRTTNHMRGPPVLV